jgi:hypothetical protein
MAQDRKKAASPKSANGQPEKPNRTLPTERISAGKQLAILRAYAIASGPTLKSVQVNDVAGIVKMAPATVSLCSAFFKDVGFLTRTSDGRLLPVAEVIEFHHAYTWNPESAASKLAQLLEQTWFGERLLPKVRFGALSQNEAIADLATAAQAGMAYRANLLVLLDFIEAAGLINQEGGQVRAASPGSVPRPEVASSDQQNGAAEIREAPAIRESSPRLTTGFSQQEGLVQFHVSVKVNMSEFAGWHPDRISSFFAGIAQVLAAKGNVEETAGGSR